jgi:NADH pyrophosphatase NudC (nudix superfamily)
VWGCFLGAFDSCVSNACCVTIARRKLITPPQQPAKPSLYPRIDPAVIMAVTAGDHILLGHQSRWVDGRYSLLAGAPARA